MLLTLPVSGFSAVADLCISTEESCIFLIRIIHIFVIVSVSHHLSTMIFDLPLPFVDTCTDSDLTRHVSKQLLLFLFYSLTPSSSSSPLLIIKLFLCSELQVLRGDSRLSHLRSFILYVHLFLPPSLHLHPPPGAAAATQTALCLRCDDKQLGHLHL